MTARCEESAATLEFRVLIEKFQLPLVNFSVEEKEKWNYSGLFVSVRSVDSHFFQYSASSATLQQQETTCFDQIHS